jgi:hypothetical protein
MGQEEGIFILAKTFALCIVGGGGRYLSGKVVENVIDVRSVLFVVY